MRDWDMKQAARRDKRFSDLYRCALKKKYNSEKGVRQAAFHYEQRYYECDRCNGWHLTSQSRGIKP